VQFVYTDDNAWMNEWSRLGTPCVIQPSPCWSVVEPPELKPFYGTVTAYSGNEDEDPLSRY